MEQKFFCFIAAFLNYEKRTSRVGNLNENTKTLISDAVKYNVSINFLLFLIFHVQLTERREFQKKISVPHIPYHTYITLVTL